MPENIYHQDRFYVNLETDSVIWMYHNPDAVSGDQFVSNTFDIDLLHEAMKECPIGPESGFEPTPIYDYLAENCRQYLSDIGDYSYDGSKEMFESEPISIGMTHTTLDKLELLFKAKELINNYCKAEFGNYASFYDPKKVGIEYTTTEDDAHEIQAYANLIDHQTEVYYDGELIATQKAESLRDYVQNQLPYLDFNELVDIPDWVIDAFLEKGLHREDLQFMQLNAWGQTYDTCIEVGTYVCGSGLAMDLYDICEGDPEGCCSHRESDCCGREGDYRCDGKADCCDCCRWLGRRCCSSCYLSDRSYCRVLLWNFLFQRGQKRWFSVDA